MAALNYFYLLSQEETYFVYVHVTNIKIFQHDVMSVLSYNSSIKFYVIYSSECGKLALNYDNIRFYYSNINFELTLLQHNFEKQRILKNKRKILELYKNICLSKEEAEINLKEVFPTKTLPHTLSNRLERITNDFLEQKISINVFDDYIPSIDSFCIFLKSVPEFSHNFNYNLFITIYSIPVYSNLIPRCYFKTITLKDVYYRNKCFFNKDGTFYDISSLSHDIEYKNYNKTLHPININAPRHIESPVLFLDYIYDFYNFGEFWDILQRIVSVNSNERLKIFGLSSHKVGNIQQYFNKQGLNFPPDFIRDYSWQDEITERGMGSTWFFRKLYFSTINNSCRGGLTPWSAFKINESYNTSTLTTEEFKIYLSRGKEKRGIVDEEILIDKLKKNNFVILDGSETLDDIIYYFTNAALILGAHSSLMKNMVWCKKNPLFIELFPPTRSHLCFIGNAEQLGFKALPILCNGNEKEEIILNELQRENLIELIKYLDVDR